MQKEDVVIVGAGVIGSSVAYHLALKGAKNILVLDRAPGPGEGSTGRAIGGFRCQFGTEINIRLSLLARQKLLQFQDEFAIDSGYSPNGYLFLAHNEESLVELRKTLRLQNDLGLTEAREVSLSDISSLNPAIAGTGIVGGVFCPTDGFIRPLNILKGYMEGAKRLGVKFLFGVDCHGMLTKKIDETQAEITHLLSSTDSFATKYVVNAAGAWASDLTKGLGFELPVQPKARQVAVISESNVLPDKMPMTIFIEDGFHFRVRDGKTLLMMPSQTQSSSVGQPDSAWIKSVSQRAKEQIPALRQCSVAFEQSWSGLYETSPDNHAIVGQAPNFRNLYLVNGSSGHGVMHSPALGQLVAELIIDGRSSLNLHPLRPSRFLERSLNHSTDFL